MAEGHSATVKLEGDSSSLERSFARSAQKAREFDASIQKVEATSKRANAVEMQRATLQERTVKSSINMEKTTQRVGFALHQVVGQTASFDKALQGVLGTFGGWGIAVGALVGVVMHFVDAQSEAKKKAIELNEELRKQAGLRREQEHDFAAGALLQRARLQEEKRQKALEKERTQVEINAREEKQALEELIVMNESRGKSAEGALRRQAELQAEVLEKQAKFAEGEDQRR